MKSIILGFEDEKGLGEGKPIKGLVSQSDQIKFVEDAKRTNLFPEGIKRLGFFIIEERITAIEVEKPKETKKPKTVTA